MVVRRLRRALFWLSRTGPFGWLVRLAFARLAWLLPVRRVAETRDVLAFEHPAPSWRPHLLLVPKRAIRSLLCLRAEDALLVGRLVRLGFQLAEARGLSARGFALLVNGGAYQDVPQLHVHLAGRDGGLTFAAPGPVPARTLAETADLLAFEHPRQQRETHLVIIPRRPVSWRELAGPAGEEIGRRVVALCRDLVRTQLPPSEGFTLLASVPPGGLDGEVCFHLVAGGGSHPDRTGDEPPPERGGGGG